MSTPSSEEAVAAAAMAAWNTAGQMPEQVSHPGFDDLSEAFLLRIPTARRIEACFEDCRADLSQAEKFMSSLGAPGWTVSAVVPLRLVGQAHEVFRSHEIDIQSWWRDVAGRVRFGSVERA